MWMVVHLFKKKGLEKNMKMVNVIVTGATSMIGITFIKECISNQVHVLAISRAGSRRRQYLPESELLTYMEADLSELDNLHIEEHYDAFYHFGWGFTDRTTRDNPVLQAKNIEYTLSAVQLAARCGCHKFIGAGSQAEYGFRTEPTDEQAPVRPTTCYGYCKYAAGKLAEKLCRDLNLICIWTRIFSVYGEYDNPNTMISYAIRCSQTGEKAVFSSGEQTWDYLHVSDAARYLYLLGCRAEESGVVNVASGNVRPLKNYIAELAEALKLSYQLGDSGRGIYPVVDKLKAITEYEPQMRFKDGIMELAREKCE